MKRLVCLLMMLCLVMSCIPSYGDESPTSGTAGNLHRQRRISEMHEPCFRYNFEKGVRDRRSPWKRFG